MAQYWVSTSGGQPLPYPKWKYHAVEAPRWINTPQEDAALSEEWSDVYIFKEYPKMLFKAGATKVVADPKEESDALGEGWTATPPAMPDVPPVTLNPEIQAIPPAGGTGSFTVTMTGPGASGTWTVEPEAEATWLHLVSPTTPQSANGSATYAVDANTEAARSGDFYVNGKTFSVTQGGATALKKGRK